MQRIRNNMCNCNKKAKCPCGKVMLPLKSVPPAFKCKACDKILIGRD